MLGWPVRYLIQIATPLIVVIALAIAAPPPEFSVAGMQNAIENFALTYLAFSAPHWIWLAITGYLETSDASSIGGLFGVNALLVCVGLLVLSSTAHEAANGWLIYFLGAPIAAWLGIVVSKRIASLKIGRSL